MESNKTMDDLTAIRAIMEKSTRFLSLSGLSGIFSGIAAIAGTVAAICVQHGSASSAYLNTIDDASFRTTRNALAADAIIVLVLALTAAIYFSFRKARKKGLKVWTPVSKSLLINMLVPLLTGGLFILYLAGSHHFEFIIPSMLIFYGLALVNVWKYTFNEIFYLGLFDITSGLIALILPEYGLYLWGFGFGILHIAYGIIMYRKYER
ncbi:MAG TPA: hypothetical protein VK155_16235 [Bacteroidales bacterium]|jgi:hypothetical protein|nr:hypothetical protein [Bacteroidales bacterium]